MKKLLFLLLLLGGFFVRSEAQMVVNSYIFKNATPLIIDSLSTQPYDVWWLRKAVSSYTGSAIRIRRSNDDAEADIGFDGSGNLNTSVITSFVGSNSAYVTTWYGQKGVANLTQSTKANQPRIVNAGTLETVGSRPAVRFLNASATYLNLAYIGTTSGATYANAVFKGAASPTSTNGPIFGDFGTDGNPDHFPYSDGSVYDGFARGNRLTVGAITPALTNATVLAIVSETNNYNLYTNNVSRYSSATGTSAINATGHRIGSSSRSGGYYWDGHIMELTLFKATPNSTDRNKLPRNQGLYHTITVN